MDLRGAKIQSFYNITAKVDGTDNQQLPRNIKVPFYQRPYRWGEENIEKLINDWHENLLENPSDNETKPYFAGSLVTVVHNGTDQNDIHDLIDGQQRFTTLYLTNYIKFLLSRVALRLAVETSNLFHLQSVYQSFIKSLNYLVNEDRRSSLNIEQKFMSIFKEIENISGLDDSKESYETKAEVEKKSRSILMLPESIETSEDYIKTHQEMLAELIRVNDLCLVYDRSSYNKELQRSLTKVCIFLNEHRAPELEIYNDGTELSEAEIKYSIALKTIFNLFSELNKSQFPNEQKAFNRAKQMIESIDSFLNEVQVCVIQTGNINDAYTLFEVLNDRSLALDDLDLIKNQFYKKYAMSNNNVSSSQIDKTLQELDELWVNSIFNDRLVHKKKLISYLAIVYITGDVTAQYNKGSGYRDVLDKYFNQKEGYSEDEIKEHFNVFMACKNLLEVSGFVVNNRDLWAVQNEYDSNISILKKTISLLLALKQEGVLSGLVNYVFSYLSNSGNESLGKFVPSAFKNELMSLMEGEIAEEIKEQCSYIWRVSVLSSKANTPRSLAIRLIRSNKLGSFFATTQQLSNDEIKEIKSEFSTYLKDWRYGQNSLKIRILFSRLISLSLDENDNLISLDASLGFSNDQIKELHIDHLEPKNPSANKDQYFNDPDDMHINGLGNMMVLTAKRNNEKSNLPISKGLNYYDQAGLGSHFLLERTRKLLEQYSVDDVPTEEFFVDRKRWLIELFHKAVEL